MADFAIMIYKLYTIQYTLYIIRYIIYILLTKQLTENITRALCDN